MLELYQYSNDVRDMTNCVNYDESIEQYRHIVKEVSRLTRPGRVSCVHCTDLRRGSLYQRDFPGDVVRVHEEMNFNFFCRITIWKDPWFFARRTRMKSLMHKTITEDSSLSRIAPPDYLLVFHKSGKNAVPIKHPHGLTTYAGAEEIPADLIRDYRGFKGDQRKNLLSHWIWRHYASPVWMDIRRKRLLPYLEAKEKPEEKHACPLQLDVVERCLTLWSNPGDVVLTPFLGIGSEAYMAVRMGRKAIGAELKGSYYRQALANLKLAHEPEETQDVLADEPEPDAVLFDEGDDQET